MDDLVPTYVAYPALLIGYASLLTLIAIAAVELYSTWKARRHDRSH
jgi:hypothetical protein